MRFYFLHPFVHNVKEAGAYMKVPIPQDAEWDSDHPELFFVSEWIYYKKKYYKEFKKLWPKAKVRVFFSGEAVEPDFNLFDYAVGFDNHLEFSDRFIRFPSPLDFFSEFITNRANEIDKIENANKILASKDGFCSFLYSNPNAHPMRDRLFYEVSEYKKIDSLGKHLNNVGDHGTGYVGHAAESVVIKARYKFAIAAENASYDGYTSEKIFTSLVAHSVPIYWGNKFINDDVNPCTFINVRDFSDFNELRDYIAYIDNHDEIWAKMVSEPWLTPAQIEYHQKRTKNFVKRVLWLFDGNVKDKVRLAHGTHQDFYRNNYFLKVYPLQLNRYNFGSYLKRFQLFDRLNR